jgi:hypothetical protein
MAGVWRVCVGVFLSDVCETSAGGAGTPYYVSER